MNEVVETERKKPVHRIQAIGVRRPEDGSFLSAIITAASDPKCNVEKMQALLAMQKEVVAEQARLTFLDAKLQLSHKLPTINKDGKIEFKDKGSGKAVLKFASFENINDVIKPILHEFGFDLWFSSEPGVAGMLNVIGHLEHRDGYVRTTVFPMPHDASGGKSGAQGWASAFSFGKRVTTIGLLNIQTRASEDRDRDGNEGNYKPAKGGGFAEVADASEKITPAQKDTLLEKIDWCGVSISKFHEHYAIDKIGDLPANLYDAAIKACEDFHANRQAKAKHG